MTKANDDAILQRYVQLARVLGRMFAPFLETIVHDLRQPESSIICIFNSHVTGRKVGDPELEYLHLGESRSSARSSR